jgi:hypothetical protein
MTETTPSTAAAVPVSDEEAAEFEVMRADAVLAGRVMSSGQYLAGLLAAAVVDTVGSPRKLPAELWPDVDPVVVQEIWDRACVVAWRASQFAGSAWQHRETLGAAQAQLVEAGHVAMAGLVGRSREVVLRSRPAHPVDGEAGREH